MDADKKGGGGQVAGPTGLAVDSAGNLYVAEVLYDGSAHRDRIQKRDAQGNWSVIATAGSDPGQVSFPSALTMDGVGNLYVADWGNNRVQMYTPLPDP